MTDEKVIRQEFKKKLVQLIAETESLSGERHILFIDKSHPPNAWNQTFESIKSKNPNILVKVIAVVPEVIQPFKYRAKDDGLEYSFPFSLHLLLHCLFEVQTRGKHETLPSNGRYSAMAVFRLLNHYSNVDFSDTSLQMKGFDYVVRSPFRNEDKNSAQRIPKELKLACELFLDFFRCHPYLVDKKKKLKKKLQEEFEGVADSVLKELGNFFEDNSDSSSKPDINVVSNRVIKLYKEILDLSKDDLIALEENAKILVSNQIQGMKAKEKIGIEELLTMGKLC